MKFYEAIEFLKKNQIKSVIEVNPNKEILVALRNWHPMGTFQTAIYDPKKDDFRDWSDLILSKELTEMNFQVYERKFVLADHGIQHKNQKEKIFKAPVVRECFHEIVRKINEKIKPQIGNGFEFINKKDTMRIIKETFGDLE